MIKPMQKSITSKKLPTISNTIKYAASLALLIALLLSPCQADNFLSSKVKDISDRKYEKAVIELLGNAKDSIVMSMYSINLSEKKNPTSLMVNDLIEARQRGVDVTA